ncbi:hypothetical protein [Treponema parvum]|uniref:hypothetical protein n=1 Tax=Treponema parvum TaxID=138851 RepID=UPI001AEC3B4A|nr:hypothetical protein [Treponema parvum]QTQ17180.1 hypothetical protein HXT04_11030 [Treponema parvum]
MQGGRYQRKKINYVLTVAAASHHFHQRLQDSANSGGIDWPKKSINLIVPFAAGGNSDVNARTLAKYLTQELKQPVVITNVAGSRLYRREARRKGRSSEADA